MKAKHFIKKIELGKMKLFELKTQTKNQGNIDQVIEKIKTVHSNKESLLSIPNKGLAFIPDKVFDLTHITNLNL